MAPRVDLKQGEMKKHVARALKSLRDGYVIVAPLEHGYVYLADAFSPFAVRAMHVLRGDEIGIASQVLGHSAQTIQGITRDISTEATAMMDAFWPGLLSLTLKPNRSLNWDLGDDRALDAVSVRVPKSKFVRALLKESGPLAAASASPAGTEPMLKLNRTHIKEWDIAVAFDSGALKSGPNSSIVDFTDSHPRIVRAGAISVAEMTEVVPLIFAQ
jgi:tRNA threonylcarbamoyl adenosine modification protein (Sua5/YciO/YrdC/YwlC family)